MSNATSPLHQTFKGTICIIFTLLNNTMTVMGHQRLKKAKLKY